MRNKIPSLVERYFWGDDLDQLNWEDHGDYIVQTLLNKGDEKAMAWLMGEINADEIKERMPRLKLTPKSKNFWQIYLR